MEWEYNKAREELLWKSEKEQEEKVLRQSGMEEEEIQNLREYDWDIFKSERRFLEHWAPWEAYEAEGWLRESGKQASGYAPFVLDVHRQGLRAPLLLQPTDVGFVFLCIIGTGTIY